MLLASVGGVDRGATPQQSVAGIARASAGTNVVSAARHSRAAVLGRAERVTAPALDAGSGTEAGRTDPTIPRTAADAGHHRVGRPSARARAHERRAHLHPDATAPPSIR